MHFTEHNGADRCSATCMTESAFKADEAIEICVCCVMKVMSQINGVTFDSEFSS